MNKIIKNEKVIKRIPLIVAIVFFLIGILLTTESNAKQVKVTELWDKVLIDSKLYDVYCDQANSAFYSGSSYTVGNKWEIENGVVKKNGEKVTNETDLNYALPRLYIVSHKDTVLSESKMNDIIAAWGTSPRGWK